ncbi:MAG: DUF308 domain-containing protein [Coriobacteriales bacterium]|nr:DUF308 domain-containing protein [Coriobacteriales bacterium]
MKEALRNGLALGIAMIILGIVVMVWPGAVMSMVCTILGIGLLAVGIVGIVKLFYKKRSGEIVEIDITSIFKNVVAIVLGIAFIVKMETFVSIMPFLTGVLVTVDGVIVIIMSLVYRSINRNWYLALIGGAIAAILGIIMIAFPYEVALSEVFVVGFAIAIGGLANIIYACTVKTVIVEPTEDEQPVEVEIEE